MDDLELEESQLPSKFHDLFGEILAQPVENSSRITPVIQNIVSSVNLDCKLNLSTIALRARNTEYNPRRFDAVMMRIKEPKTTALIFTSGKLLCTGAKTEQESKVSARKYARIVQKLGFPVKFDNFKIQNILGSCDIKFPIRLEALSCDHGKFSLYEPQIFPGLIYRMKNPRVKIWVRASGKVVIAGAKVKEDIFTAFENIYPVLEQYKKINPALN